ncbi:MAG TPA: SGNH/GDSL hydrolase family protein [Roseiarcus sp.]|jgi:phospholipase/lecithinase/hemolysin
MMNCKLFSGAFALAVGSTALLGLSAANAAGFSAEYVFGDSLSDNGNLAAALHTTFPNPPSFDNSFTNGKVAVQLLAESLGLTADASLWLTAPAVPAGTNYAVAGATSAFAAIGGPTDINLPQQVAAFSAFALDHADPNALYVVMIGGNDVRNAALQGTGIDAVNNGVGTELTEISTLADEGAKHFLVVNVPNVGIIPEFAQDNPTLAPDATTFSQLYDTELASGLAELEPELATGTTLQDFDLYDYNAGLLAKAGELGFTNTTDRCYTNTPGSAATSAACGPNAENIDSFVYWDDIHPTAPVQALWAQGFESAVPEPSTWAMLLIGFLGLGFAGYRRGALARAAA